MSDSIDRRHFLGIAAATALSAELAGRASGAVADAEQAGSVPRPAQPFLTKARDFVDVSRGNPKPYTLKGEALSKARLTPGTWRLEIVGDGSSEIARPLRLEDRHGTRPGRARGAGEVARGQVPEGDAVQQHPRAAGSGALGGRAAARDHRPRRQDRQRPAHLFLGLPQQRPGPALPVVAAVQPRDGDAALGAAAAGGLSSQRRGNPAGAGRARCAWWCRGRTASSRSSGSSGSS